MLLCKSLYVVELLLKVIVKSNVDSKQRTKQYKILYYTNKSNDKHNCTNYSIIPKLFCLLTSYNDQMTVDTNSISFLNLQKSQNVLVSFDCGDDFLICKSLLDLCATFVGL